VGASQVRIKRPKTSESGKSCQNIQIPIARIPIVTSPGLKW
ncbi:6337_t:CDS:2, partial [Entrophospora sp. SA101]